MQPQQYRPECIYHLHRNTQQDGAEWRRGGYADGYEYGIDGACVGCGGLRTGIGDVQRNRRELYEQPDRYGDGKLWREFGKRDGKSGDIGGRGFLIDMLTEYGGVRR